MPTVLSTLSDSTSLDVDPHHLEDKLEDLELSFEQRLTKLSIDNLAELCNSLELEYAEGSRKPRLLNLVRNNLYNSWGNDIVQNLQFIQTLLQRMDDMFGRGEEVPASNILDFERQRRERESQLHHQGRYVIHNPPTSDDHQSPPRIQSEHRSADTDDVNTGRQAMDLLRALADASIAQRRQFKITGAIGDVDVKKNINYTNLLSQIADGKASKFTDDEIARGIKKAVAVNCHLRAYFDAVETLELPAMLDVLRNFWQEKSASELFSELGQLTQAATEKTTSFLLRALEIRQRVTVTSAAEGKHYDQQLLQETFTRAFKTGLREGTIKTELAPFLRVGKLVNDSDLMKEVNLVEREHEENILKLKRDRKVTVAQANITTTDQQEMLKPLLEGMQTLRQELSELKSSNNNRQRATSQDRRTAGNNQDYRREAYTDQRNNNDQRSYNNDRRNDNFSYNQGSYNGQQYSSNNNQGSYNTQRNNSNSNSNRGSYHEPRNNSSNNNNNNNQGNYNGPRNNSNNNRGSFGDRHNNSNNNRGNFGDRRNNYNDNRGSYTENRNSSGYNRGTSSVANKSNSGPVGMCNQCKRDNLRYCDHCYQCGEQGHRALNCPTPKNF